MWWVAQTHGNNLWVLHLGNPLETTTILLAFAGWQRDAVSARALRVAVPVYWLVWSAVFLLAEHPQEFSHYTRPLQSLLVIAVSAMTMVRGAQRGDVAPWRSDEFLISTGLLVYFGPSIMLEPVSAVLVAQHSELVRLAFTVKAWISLVAVVLITLGVLCPIPHSNFGGSSSLAASRS